MSQKLLSLGRKGGCDYSFDDLDLINYNRITIFDFSAFYFSRVRCIHRPLPGDGLKEATLPSTPRGQSHISPLIPPLEQALLLHTPQM